MQCGEKWLGVSSGPTTSNSGYPASRGMWLRLNMYLRMASSYALTSDASPKPTAYGVPHYCLITWKKQLQRAALEGFAEVGRRGPTPCSKVPRLAHDGWHVTEDHVPHPTICPPEGHARCQALVDLGKSSWSTETERGLSRDRPDKTTLRHSISAFIYCLSPQSLIPSHLSSSTCPCDSKSQRYLSRSAQLPIPPHHHLELVNS